MQSFKTYREIYSPSDVKIVEKVTKYQRESSKVLLQTETITGSVVFYRFLEYINNKYGCSTI